MGATVHCFVSDAIRGEFLQRMEHHANVHLISEEVQAEYQRTVWRLRSDIWPTWMEGGEVRLAASHDQPGVEFQPVLFCELDYAFRDRMNNLLASLFK